MAKRRNDARPPATSATSATRARRASAEKAQADAAPVPTPATTKTREGKRWVDLGGDEISRWGRWEHVEPPSFDESMAELSDALTPPFWRDIENIQAECKAILLRHNLPEPEKRLIYSEGGDWWYADAPDAPQMTTLREGSKTHGRKLGAAFGFVYALKHSAPFSDPWYAAQLSELAFLVSQDTEASDTNQLTRIMQIGVILKDWQWRNGFKPSILTGRKQRKVLAAHRGKANSARKATAMERRDAIASMVEQTKCKGGALEKYLKRRLEDECAIYASLRTIRRDLSELRTP